MLLELKNVSKTYGAETAALNNISFTLKRGEFAAVIGSSGAGKSTLLRCINRLIEADSGSILFDGKDVMKAQRKELKGIRRKIGMVFQSYNLVERLTVCENVLHGCLGAIPFYRGIFGIYTKSEIEKAFLLLEKLGMEEFVHRNCSDLSGGQKQRVGIARALMQEPQLLLCDEPISSLDPETSKMILDYIKLFSVQGNIACIVNLHQIDLAKKYADRIIALYAGKIVYDGKPEYLSDAVLRTKIFNSQE